MRPWLQHRSPGAPGPELQPSPGGAWRNSGAGHGPAGPPGRAQGAMYVFSRSGVLGTASNIFGKQWGSACLRLGAVYLRTVKAVQSKNEPLRCPKYSGEKFILGNLAALALYIYGLCAIRARHRLSPCFLGGGVLNVVEEWKGIPDAAATVWQIEFLSRKLSPSLPNVYKNLLQILRVTSAQTGREREGKKKAFPLPLPLLSSRRISPGCGGSNDRVLPHPGAQAPRPAASTPPSTESLVQEEPVSLSLGSWELLSEQDTAAAPAQPVRQQGAPGGQPAACTSSRRWPLATSRGPVSAPGGFVFIVPRGGFFSLCLLPEPGPQVDLKSSALMHLFYNKTPFKEDSADLKTEEAGLGA
ncbi:uncharacterized protein PRD47_001536 [Ara ararauna]